MTFRAIPLTTARGGINRLRDKGSPSPENLYDLLNGYVDQTGAVRQRPGTSESETLPTNTKGLCAFDGGLRVFSHIVQSIADPLYAVVPVIHPTNNALTIAAIHFAAPFLGSLYVVAEFSDASVHHYWLNDSDVWTANTVYTEGQMVMPTVANGYAYRASYRGDPIPVWAPNALRALGDRIVPTEANGYYYQVVGLVEEDGTTQGSDTSPGVPPGTPSGSVYVLPKGYARVPYQCDPSHGEGWAATGTSLMQYDPNGAFAGGLTLLQTIGNPIIAGFPLTAAVGTIGLVAHAYSSSLATTPQSVVLSLTISATPTTTVWDMRSRVQGRKVALLDPTGSVPLTVARFDGAPGIAGEISALSPKTSGKWRIALDVLALGDRSSFSFGVDGMKYLAATGTGGVLTNGTIAPDPVDGTITFYLDATANLGWFMHNDVNVNGANPIAGTGGIALTPPAGGYVIKASGRDGALLQLRSGALALPYGLPGAFANWSYVEETIGTLWDSASRDSFQVPYGFSYPSPPLPTGHLSNGVNLANQGIYVETVGLLKAINGYSTGSRQFEIDFDTGVAANSWLGLVNTAFLADGVTLGQNTNNARESFGLQGSGNVAIKPQTAAHSTAATTAYANGQTITLCCNFTARTIRYKLNGAVINTFSMAATDTFGGAGAVKWFPATTSDLATFRLRGKNLLYPEAGFTDWVVDV